MTPVAAFFMIAAFASLFGAFGFCLYINLKYSKDD